MINDLAHLGILKDKVNTLKKLLDDFHPGLLTWSEAYHRTMQDIVNFYTEEQQDMFRQRAKGKNPLAMPGDRDYGER